MKNRKIGVLFAAMASLTAVPAWADGAAPASAPAPAYSTSATNLGTLLDDPAAKAVLVKYIPQIVSNPQIDMARGMTLKQVQAYASDQLTDDTLAKIDADLAKLPAGK